MAYTIGLDYGSLSCRGVLVDIQTGRIAAQGVFNYPHGFIDRTLPDGTPLADKWCLQHPDDYLDALTHIVPQLLDSSGVPREQVVGIGIDFAASNVVAVDEHFVPMCKTYPQRPHAWPKMWKHHAADRQADELTAVCENTDFLERYGGKISSECLLSKVVQVFEEDRFLFDRCDAFMEAADYINCLLCGVSVFSGSAAAAKGFWKKDVGYPGPDFFTKLHPDLAHLPAEKLADHYPNSRIAFPYEKAGTLCPEMAKKLGLCPGIAVSGAQMDAYAGVTGIGITQPGQLLMVVGTSTAVLVMDREKRLVEGTTGCIPDANYPGLWTYACGQASVGDAFGWFVDNCVPESYHRSAREQGMSVHAYLTELASKLEVGESGLIALDWLGGNRSCLGDPNLSGMILGLTLQTRPEEIYRALIEATAFGMRAILEAFHSSGVQIHEITLCGGIPNKNEMLVQIYADVFGKPLRVSHATQAPALGSAIYAAAAAGCGSLETLIGNMSDQEVRLYTPNEENVRRYELLYQFYMRLHDYFGRGENPVMHQLRSNKSGMPTA